MTETTAICVTRSNWDEHLPMMTAGIANAELIGIDLETEDSRAHAGIKRYNSGNRSLVFDINATTICGLSLWPEHWPFCYYINLGHADVENQVPWPLVRDLLDSKPAKASWVAHNAPFEITMLKTCVDYDLKDYICTLAMAVSAYGPDEYDIERFNIRGLEDMGKLIPRIVETCRAMTQDQDMLELLGTLIGKESDASHSYNGHIKEIAYGYGLKQAVKSFFNYEMKTFKDTLGAREHMGQLTSAETAAYGADDAYWAVKLYRRLLDFMLKTNNEVVPAFFHQELPMVGVYAEAWRHGVRIDRAAVEAKQGEIRTQYARKVRELKARIRNLLPFDPEPHPLLQQHEDWYAKNYRSYREKITVWAFTPDAADHFIEATRLSGAIPNAWAEEIGAKVPKGQLNLTHYMPMRTLMYDLFRRPKLMVVKGKVQSDAYARGRMKEMLVKEGNADAASVMTTIGDLATIEQVSKLYLTPYLMLADPATGKLHPVLGSEQAARRMTMRTPNAAQLSKRNPETTYVRGFYLADYDDHVIVSIDWSQIELVLIGEESGDPYFADCFGQLPYKDLHEIASADALGATVEKFRALKKAETFLERYGASDPLLLNPRGEPMEPAKAFKYWRTEVGKGSNFNYWYSGALSTVGERLGWTSEEMWEATERYRNRFSVAEQWRQEEIAAAQMCGYTMVSDGHRRVRYEATPAWQRAFMAKWKGNSHPCVEWFAGIAARRIQSRANNQIINAKIQGGCSALAKRSIIGIRNEGWGPRDARFMFPVHDELVYSVHRDRVAEFIPMARRIMCNHPGLVSKLKLDCAPSVGLTFEPSGRLGQIELREAPAIDCVPPELVGGELPVSLYQDVVSWLFNERSKQ